MSEKITGTDININAFSSKAELNISGAVEQATRSGKNLLKRYSDTGSLTVNGVTITQNEDGTFTLNGTSTADTWIEFIYAFQSWTEIQTEAKIPLYTPRTYTLSMEIISGTATSWFSATLRDASNMLSINLNSMSKTFTGADGIYSGYISFGASNTFTDFTVGIQLEQGTSSTGWEKPGAMPSIDFPSEINAISDSVNLVRESKNKFLLPENQVSNGITYTKNADGTFNLHGTSTANTTFTVLIPFDKTSFKQGKYYTLSTNFIVNTANTPFFQVHDYNNYDWANTIIDIPNGTSKRTIQWGNMKGNNINFSIIVGKGRTIDFDNIQLQLEEGEQQTYFVASERHEITMPIQQPMFDGDTFEVIDGVLYEKHNWNKVVLDGTQPVSYFNAPGLEAANSSETVYISISPKGGFPKSDGKNIFYSDKFFKKYVDVDDIWGVGATKVYVEGMVIDTTSIRVRINKSRIEGYSNDLTTEEKVTLMTNFLTENPVIVYYQLATPTYIEATQDQKVAYEQMQNTILFSGVNNIYTTNELKPLLILEYYKIIEEFDMYLSENGHLVIREFGIDLLVNLSESSIPTMPEATEATVRIAGKDGDVVLKTTYEPIPFEIVCYTEDNLTVQEKVAEEKKINAFLNSIKNKTKTFAMEVNEVFYKVKYNAALTTIKYPKHIQFSIPFKSSESYGKALIESSIVGNNSTVSDTIEPVGAIFKIDGPAQTPKISLNDYLMHYDNVLLEGEQLIINSLNSTVTLINESGTETNAMTYYNHEFPQIQNGTNELKVLSGIDNENQVQVKWYDLKL